jgi:AraC-like DNA-binding protein
VSTIDLDARQFPANERAELIRELIWSSVVRVEIQHQPQADDISAVGRITDIGALNICSIRSNATTVERTARLAHNPVDEYLFLGLQLSGSSVVVQGGREAVLEPGDLAVYDTRRPYTLLNEGGIHQHFFRIPMGLLELPGRVVESLTAVRFDGRRPLARVTGGYLGNLASTGNRLTAQEAEQVAAPSVGLIRALLTAQLLESPLSREHLDNSLEVRVMEYIRTHLSDRDLSAARIAREHHISVRHLYRLMGQSGITLGDWIRERRLEQCRSALADPANTSTITTLAHQWGFTDLTHFGRAFKATYGLSPREWRAANRPSPPGKTT